MDVLKVLIRGSFVQTELLGVAAFQDEHKRDEWLRTGPRKKYSYHAR